MKKDTLLNEYNQLVQVLNRIDNIISINHFVCDNDTQLIESLELLKKGKTCFESNEKMISEILKFQNQYPVFKFDKENEIITYYRENGLFNLPLSSFFSLKKRIINSYSIKELLYDMPKKEKKEMKKQIFDMKKEPIKSFEEKVESLEKKIEILEKKYLDMQPQRDVNNSQPKSN